ncbi:hypothetical protein WN51_06299 [Melipona quadrifasciata]|uniref:Uncharacterized protein n=1 Tax=Melipona quadrifasciata TaxID=166423 RepID=A0A0M8ZSM2_9HYME|nr:hypothetical protein WN51_06299 [Melipona quadrifasciata]
MSRILKSLSPDARPDVSLIRVKTLTQFWPEDSGYQYRDGIKFNVYRWNFTLNFKNTITRGDNETKLRNSQRRIRSDRSTSYSLVGSKLDEARSLAVTYSATYLKQEARVKLIRGVEANKREKQNVTPVFLAEQNGKRVQFAQFLGSGHGSRAKRACEQVGRCENGRQLGLGFLNYEFRSLTLSKAECGTPLGWMTAQRVQQLQQQASGGRFKRGTRNPDPTNHTPEWCFNNVNDDRRKKDREEKRGKEEKGRRNAPVTIGTNCEAGYAIRTDRSRTGGVRKKEEEEEEEEEEETSKPVASCYTSLHTGSKLVTKLAKHRQLGSICFCRQLGSACAVPATETKFQKPRESDRREAIGGRGETFGTG